MNKFQVISLFLLAGLLLPGCSEIKEQAPGSLAMSTEQYELWEIALVEMRIEKNELFQDPEQTPLPETSMEAFEGLNYFLPAPELRFQVKFQAEAAGDTVTLAKRKGQNVPYLRRGKVTFHHEGQDHVLTVFGPAVPTDHDYLWLPFFDPTNGQETYPGGRSLDIQVTINGVVDLDFNYAYNPLCDYNPDRYNCTLPPPENTLPFAVKAGETLFNSGH